MEEGGGLQSVADSNGRGVTGKQRHQGGAEGVWERMKGDGQRLTAWMEGGGA